MSALFRRIVCIVVVLAASLAACQSSDPIDIKIDWNGPAVENKTAITLQVVENPPLRRGSPIHDNAWNSLRDLKASDVRLALWFPYPRLSVAEILPPTSERTYWDFSAMDPLVEDFFAASDGRPTVFSPATPPRWMFDATKPVEVPADPDAAVWDYEQGKAFRDPKLKEISQYYERVARWYMKGGFRDEKGEWHASGHHFKPTYWEIFNEPEYEHNYTPADYTKIYDAITKRLHKVDSSLKFTGMSLAVPDKGDEFFNYFLDHSHHAPHTNLDAISYHFYALGKDGETIDQQASSFFSQADHFLDTVKNIERIRSRLSPRTETQINETGCIAGTDQGQGPDKMSGVGIPPSYWNLCGSMFAYLAAKLAGVGIQAVGASQLLGYPSQYPSVSLLAWNTGLPNPRYDYLRLLIDNLSPGDRLLAPAIDSAQLYAVPIVKRGGEHRLLLINKTPHDVAINLPGDFTGDETHVDITTIGISPLAKADSRQQLLKPFAVMFYRPTAQH